MREPSDAELEPVARAEDRGDDVSGLVLPVKVKWIDAQDRSWLMDARCNIWAFMEKRDDRWSAIIAGGAVHSCERDTLKSTVQVALRIEVTP